MNLSNTTVKLKRYSTYGWNVIDPETSKYLNTLSLGEIGLLLGIDGKEVTTLLSNVETANPFNTVLEVRIGSVDNQYFFDAPLIGSQGSSVTTEYCIKTFPDLASLPAMGGSINNLYVVKSENAIYRWDDELSRMVKVTAGSDWTEIRTIDGGSSSAFSWEQETR